MARGVITKHVVKLRRHGSNSVDSYELPASASEHIITGLEFGSRYDVLVVSGTNVGFPPDSADMQWETYAVGDIPPPDVNSLINVTISVVSPTSIVLTWNAVTPDSVPGILGYKIYFQPEDGPQKSIIVTAEVTRHELVNVVANTTYEITFCLFTETSDEDVKMWTVRTPPLLMLLPSWLPVLLSHRLLHLSLLHQHGSISRLMP
jgi:hypothetical protein